MTDIGGGHGYGGYGRDAGRHESQGHDVLSSGEDLLTHGVPIPPDPSVRRQAAEENARAAEARAVSAAADAKVAIELAARAAAAADAAARAAVQADAAARAAVQADAAVRAAVRADTGAHAAPQWAPGPRHGAPDASFDGGPPFADLVPDTDVLHHVVPAPRLEPARHAAGPDTPELLVGSPAELRRSAAAETTVFAEPLVADEPVTELVDTSAAVPDADQAPEDQAPEDQVPEDQVPEDQDQPTALVAAAPAGRRRRRARAAAGQPAADDDRYENDDDAPATGGRRAARRAAASRKGLFRRRAPKLAAGAAVGALALSGVVWLTGGADTMEPAAVVETAPAVPQLPAAAAPDADPDTATLSQGDPLSERGTEFLAALREAGVPTSQGGAAETEAAELVCGELADGVDEARIARALPATLPTVTRAQAADLVDIAQETYCTS